MKLYEITEAYRNIEMLLNDADNDDDLVLFNSALIDIQGRLEDKVENIVNLIKNSDADIKALKEEEQRLNKKRKALENKIQSMKDYVLDSLVATGTESIKYPTFKVSIKENPESIKVTDISKIPHDYFVPQDPKLDKRALKEVIKYGKSIPGAELVRTKSVSIR